MIMNIKPERNRNEGNLLLTGFQVRSLLRSVVLIFIIVFIDEAVGLSEILTKPATSQSIKKTIASVGKRAAIRRSTVVPPPKFDPNKTIETGQIWESDFMNGIQNELLRIYQKNWQVAGRTKGATASSIVKNKIKKIESKLTKCWDRIIRTESRLAHNFKYNIKVPKPVTKEEKLEKLKKIKE